MIYKLFSYLQFLIKSTNQHGVHSPFVFDFVTKGLYKKRVENINFDTYTELKSLSKKQQKLLSKIIHYFKIDTIYFDYLTFIKTSNKNYKTLYISNLKNINKFKFNNLSSKHFIITEGIYRNKESHQNWQKIIQKKEVTVTIDLFYFGLIFFRKEQAKEHFKIRA